MRADNVGQKRKGGKVKFRERGNGVTGNGVVEWWGDKAENRQGKVEMGI
jgi:hypothetical protein